MALAVAAIRYAESLPRTRTGEVIGRQLVRCGTGAGANYRAACRSRSTAEFVARLGVVEEEADEALYWLEVLRAVGVDQSASEDVARLPADVLSMAVASIRTTRRRAAK